MCIRIILPPTADQIAEAQWSLVDDLEQALDVGWRHGDTRRSLRDALRGARARARSPQRWAETFAQALVESLTTLQTAAASVSRTAHETERLRLERDALRCTVAEHDDDPLQEQVERLTQERDEWLRQTAEHAGRVTQLKGTLSLVEEKHRQDVARLQQTIEDLNRIVAQQQEELDALRQ